MGLGSPKRVKEKYKNKNMFLFFLVEFLLERKCIPTTTEIWTRE